MKLVNMKSSLFFSSLIVLALNAPAVFAMENQEMYESATRHTQALGEKFLELTHAGEYQEVLNGMACLRLPELALDDLTPGKNYLHSYILNVTYSFLHSSNKLGRELENSNVKSAAKYLERAVANGSKFWKYYATHNNPAHDMFLISILNEIISAEYSLLTLQPQKTEASKMNLRRLLQYDKDMINKMQVVQGSKESEITPEKMGLKKYNYLIHMLSYMRLIDEKESVYYRKEIDEVISYLETSKHALYASAVEQRDILGKSIISQRQMKPSARLSSKSKARLKKKGFEADADIMKRHVEANQENLPPSTVITFGLHEIQELINASDYDYIASKNKNNFIESQRRASAKILEVEEKIFKFINKESEYKVCEENLKLVYVRGAEILDLPLKDLVFKNMICFMNSGDYQNTLLRLTLYEEILGELPKKLKIYPAYFKFMLGDPLEWANHVEEQNQKNNKKKEAQNKKRTATIKKELELNKHQENERLAAKQPQAGLNGEKEKGVEKVKELPRENAEQPSFSAFARENSATEYSVQEEKLKTKKRMHWSDYPMEFVRDPITSHHKETKVKGEEGEKPEFFISSSAYKLYNSLYSDAPRFTPEGASKLLEAFGMKLEGGKGSHKKFSFADALVGRNVLNGENNVVFRFPNLANASYAEAAIMVIPRWEGDKPPHYMIGAIRHILEKSGAHPTNVFKKNEKKD